EPSAQPFRRYERGGREREAQGHRLAREAHDEPPGERRGKREGSAEEEGRERGERERHRAGSGQAHGPPTDAGQEIADAADETGQRRLQRRAAFRPYPEESG